MFHDFLFPESVYIPPSDVNESDFEIEIQNKDGAEEGIDDVTTKNENVTVPQPLDPRKVIDRIHSQFIYPSPPRCAS